MSIPEQKYYLLADAAQKGNTTVDHLTKCIIAGSLAAYVKPPAGCVPFGVEPPDYIEAKPPFALVDDKLSSRLNGMLCDCPLSEVRVDIGQVQVKQSKPEKKLLDTIVDNAKERMRREGRKVTHRDLHKELRQLFMMDSEVSAVIKSIKIGGDIVLYDGNTIPYKRFTNRFKVKQ